MCIEFTLREVIWLWQVSTLAGQCSQLKAAVKTSGIYYCDTEAFHLCPSFMFLVIAKQAYLISAAKENFFLFQE